MPDTSPANGIVPTPPGFAEFALGADGSTGRVWDRPEYRFLYNSYYDAVGARHPRPERGLVTRPGVAEVADYRAHVDKAVEELCGAGLDESTAATLVLGTHHEEQHQELLLIDIKHVLSMNPAVGPVYADVVVPAADDPGPIGWVGFDGGVVEVGRGCDTRSPIDGFAFDNEGPRHEVRLYDFALADRLVTVGEWLAFVDDGGYRRPELWKSDGWSRAQAEGWQAPLYWWRDPDDPDWWWIHTLTGLRVLDPHEPVVHVSHYEANASPRGPVPAFRPSSNGSTQPATGRSAVCSSTSRSRDSPSFHPTALAISGSSAFLALTSIAGASTTSSRTSSG